MTRFFVILLIVVSLLALALYAVPVWAMDTPASIPQFDKVQFLPFVVR